MKKKLGKSKKEKILFLLMVIFFGASLISLILLGLFYERMIYLEKEELYRGICRALALSFFHSLIIALIPTSFWAIEKSKRLNAKKS